MRASILLALLFSAAVLPAQTYFYIGQIAVQPANPTTNDAVSIQLIGDLSDTGAGVTVNDAGVSGYMVQITLTATSAGGFTVLVPHTEMIQLGQLPAGTYTIDLTDASTGILDMAPAPQHVFTVSGGAPCDELLVDVGRHPFTDTAVVVHVQNNTTELFDYPNFILFDADGDTLAFEPVNFFGIAQESWHVLPLIAGAVLPATTFDGRLELWTGFTSELACAWDRSFDLCPPPPCSAVFVAVQNAGGGLALGTFNYLVQDAGGGDVASGSWELDAGTQFASDSLCLSPGAYTFQVFPQQPPTGGQLQYTVSAPGWLVGATGPVHQAVPAAAPFGLYLPCASPGQAIAEQRPVAFTVTDVPGGVRVQHQSSGPLGAVQVFDAVGRMSWSGSTTSDRLFVPLGAPGIHFVHAMDRAVKVLHLRDR